MQASKNPEYQINETDSGCYHLRVNQKLHNPVTKQYSDNFRIVKFRTKREFDNFQANKHVLGLDGEELIHDPSLKGADEITEKKAGRPRSNQ